MIERFRMHFAPGMDERMVSVFLPGGYEESDAAYPVMYMFDGQNAFEEDKADYGNSWSLHGLYTHRLIEKSFYKKVFLLAPFYSIVEPTYTSKKWSLSWLF